jgi:hypothetical protein
MSGRARDRLATAIFPGERPPPPPDLAEQEAAEWQKIVARFPADWFTVETHPLLAQLTRHICMARYFGRQLAELRKQPFADVADQLDQLTRLHARETRRPRISRRGCG